MQNCSYKKGIDIVFILCYICLMKINKTFKIELELWDMAKEKAAKLGRSLSGQIRYLLRKFIEED